MVTLDDYLNDIVEKGDDGSNILRAITAPTLRNCKYVDILKDAVGNNFPVLRIPEDYYVVVHSVSGNVNEIDPGIHAATMINNLVAQAQKIGAEPIALADVVDSNSGNLDIIKYIGDSMIDAANFHNLAIMNGENAILGERINPEYKANVSGTMISLIKKDKLADLVAFDEIPDDLPGVYCFKSGTTYGIFDPEGKAVAINSDGIGTKTEFYERLVKHVLGLEDSLAMKEDDSIKAGATVKVVSDVVETNGNIPIHDLIQRATELGKEQTILYALQHEQVGERIHGYNKDASVYNVSGSAVCTIDEKFLENPPKPAEGEFLIAIKGKPNPRSNGITDRRKLMVEHFGENWHKNPNAKEYAEFLSTPSSILYPLFREAMNQGLATSVYHMSGGAFKGKLAAPLAKHGLFCRVENSFEPHKIDLELQKLQQAPNEVAYAKWPMGTDGFITTNDVNSAIKLIESYGFEARKVSVLEKTNKTGVELEGIKDSNGNNLYYSGIKEK